MTNQPFEEQDAPGPGPEEATEAIDVEALKNERDALQDRLLRTAAEFDNYRKRIDRERREQGEAAAASLLVEVLPVVDNLERALQAPATPESASYRAGVELILRQMVDLLRKRGVTPIDVLGADFDPRIHQAVSQESSDTHRDGEVMEELQRGYMLGDRLLRPAMVKVATS
jgi:molecular chaperone GrpE